MLPRAPICIYIKRERKNEWEREQLSSVSLPATVGPVGLLLIPLLPLADR
jgi:hypothetical protein